LVQRGARSGHWLLHGLLLLLLLLGAVAVFGAVVRLLFKAVCRVQCCLLFGGIRGRF
jgi:hypothetical protein